MTVCYKICRVVNGKYFSEFGKRYPKFDIEYKLGESVYPPIGKLFVYLDIVQAITSISQDHALLQCYANGDIEYINNAEFENINKQENFSDYWTNRIVKSHYTIVRNNIALANSINSSLCMEVFFLV